MLKNKKYFYFLKLKLIMYNNKYVIFVKKKLNIENSVTIHSKLIYPLFNNKKVLKLLKHNFYLLCFNNFNTFLLLNNIEIYSFLFSGFFINNNLLVNLKYYYLFYTKNFKIYIYLI
jgi:hypothetical protein